MKNASGTRLSRDAVLFFLIYMKLMRDNRGSVTVAAAIVLSGILVLNTVLYDYVSYHAQEGKASAGLLLACKSVLAGYDSFLAQKYGLYGYNTDSGTSVSDEFAKYYQAEDVQVKPDDRFSEPEILKRQILDLMKIKTPVNLTELMLRVLGIVEAAEGKGEEYRSCGQAAELLTGLQEVQKKLSTAVCGFFPGDPSCVNGYAKSASAVLAQSPAGKDWHAHLTALIGMCEQYLEYNRKALFLCNELSERKETLLECLNGLSESEDAALLRKQAFLLENGAAAEQLKHNISVLTKRIAVLQEIRNGTGSSLKSITELFLQETIYSEITVHTVYAENLAAAEDIRAELSERLSAEGQKYAGRKRDSYVVPDMEYAAFPSVRAASAAEPASPAEIAVSLEKFDGFAALFSLPFRETVGDLLQSAGENILIDDYILSFMTTRMDLPSDDRLNNEIEYILNGAASSDENNRSAERKIIALRFVFNFINIMKNEERSALAETIARGIAASLSMGAGVILYKYIIISAWAMIDAYLDMEKLLSGGCVPMIGSEESAEGREQNYAFYLRLILFMTPQRAKILRICDMIELNMQETTGAKYRLSGVYHKISASCKIRMDFISPLFLGKEQERYYKEFHSEYSYESIP